MNKYNTCINILNSFKSPWNEEQLSSACVYKIGFEVSSVSFSIRGNKKQS